MSPLLSGMVFSILGFKINTDMGSIHAFVFTTLNGYYEGPGKGDISWHHHGRDENAHAETQLKEGNSTLLFGRVTYEMMASYWPTPMAAESDPEVAPGMNRAKKIVFSKSLRHADWENTEIISGDIAGQMRALKAASDTSYTILGSNSIVTLFAKERLLDSLSIMIDPVLLSSGNTLLQGFPGPLNLQLKALTRMQSGVVLLDYIPEY